MALDTQKKNEFLKDEKNKIIQSKEQHSALKVKDLSIGYKNTVVASEINFDSLSGELIGIIGVNGAGKSTLLRTLGNIQAALSGSITIDEKSLASYNSVELASKIGVVLTESLASNNLTVQELIALGRQPYTNWIGTLTDTDASKINNAIALLKLEELVHKKCYELSDGQLQRVLIARAFAQDTSIILLDEPTSHLDLYHKVQILKGLKSISQETGKTILFTSHEIEIAIQLCDKILVLKKTGSSYGKPSELINQGAFDKLFPADTISFDSTTGSFRFKK